MIANNKRATTNSDPAAQSGLDRSCPEQAELDQLRVDFHAQASKRRAASRARRRGPAARVPTKMILPSISLRSTRPCKSFAAEITLATFECV